MIAVEDKYNRQLRACFSVVNDNFIGPLPVDSLRWSQYIRLKVSGSRIAPLYGLAKIHKTDTPLRPIISFPGSAYHNLATHLADIVSRLPESQIHCVASTLEDKINGIEGDKYLVSYDVESLFTNVPLTEAIEITCNLLLQNFGDSLGYSRKTLMKLLLLCSRDCIFQFNDKLYIQHDGVAMGSPLGPLLANVFMSVMDNKIRSSCNAPKLYKRYVDDTLCVVNDEAQATVLCDHLNSLSPSIHFTMEGMHTDSSNT